MSNFLSLISHQAEDKFGKGNEDAITKWVEYWEGTLSRNVELVEIFRAQTRISFLGKTVVDVGCGTGGLSQIVASEGGKYFGLDYYPAILEMAQAFVRDLGAGAPAAVLRCTATHLPLADSSADYVAAFDVIEHLVGGEKWQSQFLCEVCRILRPKGVLLLTTPNRLHPFEGHTLMYGPQYLPIFLADRYIRWRNPSFLQEYRSFREIHLFTPWKMKKFLEAAGLKLLPDFPWGMPLEDYSPNKRICLRAFGVLGLGWLPPSSFWIAACRREEWEEMKRLKISRRKN